MAETEHTSDLTAENGNNLEEVIQEEPNPERKYSKTTICIEMNFFRPYLTSWLGKIY